MEGKPGMRSRTSKKKHRERSSHMCIVFIVVHTCQDAICIRSEHYYTSHGLCFLKHALQGNEKTVALTDSTGTTPLALNVRKADLQHEGDCFKEGPTTSRRCSYDSRQCLQRL